MTKRGYWVVRANVFDNEYIKYIEIATEVIKQFNGNFLIRGGNQVEYENTGYERTVVVEFKTYQDAVDCYNSSEYKCALKYARKSSKRLVAIVEGLN